MTGRLIDGFWRAWLIEGRWGSDQSPIPCLLFFFLNVLMYVELHASSAFSFLDGASLPEALVDRAAKLGYPALALLDRDGVYGAPRFHKAARAAGIKPIVGCELTIAKGSGSSAIWAPVFGLWRLPVLVESQEGYRNLCRLLTRLKLEAPKGEGVLKLEDLDGFTTGLVAVVGRAALMGHQYGVGGLLDRIVGLFGRSQVYVELQRHLLRDEELDNQALVALAEAYHVSLVATNGVRFASADDRPLYDVQTCLRNKTTLDRAGRRLVCNSERYLKSPAAMTRLFHDRPDALVAAGDLATRLDYTMDDLGYRFPTYPVPAGDTMISFLRAITDVGARERYRPYHERARRQLARELALIEKLDLAGYFLIVWDIVNFCRQQNILVQGRGSAANSAVCYSLGITAVDPVEMDLLFERFLSEERNEWPDIDLDLPSGDRRERVIQYVYERYGRLGAGMTANVITYRGRSAARDVGKVLSIPSDQVDRLAKAMNHFEWTDPEDSLARQLDNVGIDRTDSRVRHFGALWRRMQDLPRHLGQHSGGMVICQGRLDEVVPLENASMPGRVVVQWDKDDCADMGLVKVDLLGLGMMAVLQDTFALIDGKGVGPAGAVDLARLPANDSAVYRMLQDADTVGLFQVESRAQMATLPRLKPKCFYDLVVEVAIIRPGPIVGQMVHPYLKRRAGREPVRYAHPSLEPILRRTLGVPLFQEQLLRVAMVAGGFSGGEAEQLRRAFGFKRSARRMTEIEIQLRDGMAKKGITGEPADEIVRSISSFASYGFPESHAASFALLVYASAYLKAHYPAAFYTALLNNQPMGFYHPATLVKDAQRHGVRFGRIDVQYSGWECAVEPDGSIRLGLCYVNGLNEETGRSIEHQRSVPEVQGAGTNRQDRQVEGSETSVSQLLICPKCGCDDPSLVTLAERATPQAKGFCSICAADWVPVGRSGEGQALIGPRFRSVEDLFARAGLRRDELATLAEIGALNSFGYDRRSALWQVECAVRAPGELFAETGGKSRSGTQTAAGVSKLTRWTSGTDGSVSWALRGDSDITEDMSSLGRSPLPPMTPGERTVADYVGTGVTIGPHPVAFQRQELALRGVLRAIDLPQGRNGRRIRVAGTVIARQRPETAKGFMFLTLEDETGFANIIVRPDVLGTAREVILERSFLLVEGVLQQQDGVTSVQAERFHDFTFGGGMTESRDFY
ncbi:MAG: error-prone DNA polymerase [Acidobacteriota bacterium]|nr:error-prone DNA polymerase [Acidobacteriota bacterium]